MNKQSVLKGLIILLVITNIMTLYFYDKERKTNKNPNIPYSVIWNYKENEVITLDKENLLFDEDYTLIKSLNSDKNNVDYELKAGKYFLLIKDEINPTFTIINIEVE